MSQSLTEGGTHDNLGCLAKEICKQSVVGVAWFLFADYSKMWQERDALRKEFIKQKKEPETKNLENSRPIQIERSEKACPGENTKNIARKPIP